jgi:O-antigen/teichoic acid export membrane protein
MPAHGLDGLLGPALTTGGIGAAVSTFVSFALAPTYLVVLRHRDDKNRETSGFALSILAMIVAVVTFVVASALLSGPCGLWWAS